MTLEQPCSCSECADLPVNPFEALRVSYGMLLGADDFRVLMGNPRGKQMLHTSWLHGSGVVWGYQVFLDGEFGLRVSPGLAVDGLGRELGRTSSACLDLRDWCTTHDAGGKSDGCGDRTLHACLVAELECCTDHPVPALADPCDVNRTHDYDSRVSELVHLDLRLGQCTHRRHTYHRVRVLLGLDEVGSSDPAGEDAYKCRDIVAGTPGPDRARELLRQFHHLAALDNAELRPANEADGEQSLFPVLEQDAAVPLACLELDLHDADGCTTITNVGIHLGCRTALLPTSTIQELTWATVPGRVGDAGGPRVYALGVAWSDDRRRLDIPLSAAVIPGSVRRAIRITSLSERGWVDEDIDTVRYDPGGPAITVGLADRPVNELVRVTVKGTGSTPVIGVDPPVPLAGVWGGPPGSTDDGHDAVLSFVNFLSENGETP